jgi:hypothetical protein
MIVELCGMPAAGKTTMARRFADGLREYGHQVELISSYRPTEADKNLGPVASSMRRLTRPLRETLAAIGEVMSGEHHDHFIGELLQLLPPPNIFSAMRMRQYLLRLLLSWERTSRSRHIALFDQGFMQGVASLMVLTKSVEPTAIERAVSRIPKPDLLIRIHASEELLKARLHKRRQRQSRFERLLELDLTSNLRFGPALDVLCASFNRQVAPVIPVQTDNAVSYAAALARIRREAEDARLTISDDTDVVASAHLSKV